MIGPEHYTEAERLRNAAVSALTDSPFPHLRPAELLAAAQVHATLALAAATAIAAYAGESGPTGMPHADYDAWDQVAGVSPLLGWKAGGGS